MKKLLSIILVLGMCCAILAGCAPTESKNPPAPAPATETTAPNGEEPAGTGEETTTKFGIKPFEERQTLRLGFFAGSPLSYPFLFADKEGFFDELNIDIEYQTFTNGPAMMEANADWDMAGAGLGGTLVGMAGYDIKMIGISDYEENLALFARKDSKLATDPTNPESWKGTKWLYPIGTTAQATLVAALETVGLGMGDIESVNMDVTSALTGFQGGEGDGLGVWNAIAFAAEDSGFVRVSDAGKLGFVAPCATLATKDALENKRELVKVAYAVFYKTWEWCNESEENMQKAVDYYLEHCLDEGIKCDESVAKRVMEWYRAPFLAKSIDIMTSTSPDAAGLYTKRDLIQAEKDVLVGMDFFISQGKYTAEQRTQMLDNQMIDPSIATEVKAMFEEQGLTL